ncbi:unnamed protein product [Ectocarpus sp. 12 AP-2014]
MLCPLDVSTDDEPGIPGEFDEDKKPYFFPARRQRDADNAEQRDGFICRWEYRGHSDCIKGVRVTGEDSFGRMRIVSTDGRSIDSWLELGNGDSVKTARVEHNVINAIAYIPPLNVVVAASGDSLVVFDGRTMRYLATLSTSKKVLLQLQYNLARDEIISGGSDGCFVWRLTATPFKPYAQEVVPYELTLLHGFKGCSHWAGRMFFDERSQVIITIDGMKVQKYDAGAATTNLYIIKRAHESPVTVVLWVGESENIVTGCMGGLLKIWACQHTDANGVKRSRHGRWRQRKRVWRARAHRKGCGRSPALVKSFEGHSGGITGLVRHCLNSSYIVSSGEDGTLRVWDVDRLAAVTTVRVPWAVSTLWAFSGSGGQARLVCASPDGGIKTMVVRQVCHPLSFDTDVARNIHYFPPVGQSIEEPSSVSANGKRSRESDVGLVLVQMKQGLWGLMPETLLWTTGTQPATNTKTSVSSTATTCVSQAGLIPPGTDESHHSLERTESEISNLEFGDGDAVALDEGNTTSSLFHSWPSLSCVVERYSHHVLSRRRRRVICLADSGVLDTYAFDAERGEARKISSRDIDLHANGATATSMCLLPGIPDYVLASLERLLPSQTSIDDPLSDRPICGGAIGEGGNDDNYRDRPCGRTGRRKQASQVAREKADQVVAIGTSHGGVILVETVANGTTLDFLEGVFASKVVHMAFSYASSDGAILPSKADPGNELPTTCAQVGRLICVGHDTNGAVALKGLAVSSLTEQFSLRLIEAPTCVRVASERPVLAVGYADGTVNAINFGQDRVAEVESGQLIGTHTAEISTIAFSTRYHCMATGSADGLIMIWDLNGQQLHGIYLQSPALAVEFMEISGELLVSSSSGLSRIHPRGWCPLRLLIANDRADRRAAAERSGSNKGIRCGREDGLASVTVRGNEARVREDESSIPSRGDSSFSGRRRPADHGVRKNATGRRFTSRVGLQILNQDAAGSSETKDGVVRQTKLQGDTNGNPDKPPDEIVEGEWTPPEDAGMPGPSRLVYGPTPRGGGGKGTGASASTNRVDQNVHTILDCMSAKVSSIPTSPPPPLVRTAKDSTKVLHSTLVTSSPWSVTSRGGKKTPGGASAGDNDARPDERPEVASMMAPLALPIRGAHPQAGGSISFANNSRIERGATDDTSTKGGAGDETPIGLEEGSQTQSIVDSGFKVLPAVKAALGTPPCDVSTETSRFAPALSSRTSLTPLSDNFLDGILPSVPSIPQVPVMPLRSARCGKRKPSLGKALRVAHAVADKVISNIDAPVEERHRRPSVKKSTPTHRLKRDATSDASQLKTFSVAFAPAPAASTSLVMSGLALRTIEPSDSNQGMGASAKDLHGVREGASIPGTVTEDQPRSVRSAPRIRQASHVPATPACDPQAPETASPAMTIRWYRSPRRGEQRPRLTPPFVLPGGGIGAGTATAAAAKDSHSYKTLISIPRAVTKRFLEEDVTSLMSRPTLSPSPPVVRTSNCRAFGVISPRSWSADADGECHLSSPLRAHTREGTLCEHRNTTKSNGSVASFFPARFRVGHRIPVTSRRWEQAVSQGR